MNQSPCIQVTALRAKSLGKLKEHVTFWNVKSTIINLISKQFDHK